MKVFSWVSVLISFPAMFYVALNASKPIAILGWTLCILWTLVSHSLYYRAREAEKLIQKARTQNSEFAGGLVDALKNQAQEIQNLQEEKLFLMITLDNYSKGNGNGEKN